ncbi:MAG: CpXC domain-containing protein [Lachnospiraceae bacterium]|nr:CpXC domain-containing protein [Lachnospiraceae bacterium]
MAEVRKEKVFCPKCKKEIEIGMWDSIDIPYDIEQKEKILKNIFFKVHCEDCKILFPIAYRCQYNDMENKYMIWFVPGMEEKDRIVLADYNEKLKNDNTLRLAQGGYRYRIVRTDNELREKVFIFEEGFDDRIVEMMKVIYAPMIKQSVAKDHKILGIYFDRKKDGKYRWVIILDRMTQPLMMDINMDIYEDMKGKLKDIIEEKTPEGLAQINALWARDVMMTQVKRIEGARA